MKTRSIIVDDEAGARESLKQLVQKYCPEIELSGMADSIDSARRLINSVEPNLVFLDIELTNGNSFDLLNSLEETDFHIIFTTAYDQYALKAIKFSALDYLLKPIDIDELKKAVQKFHDINGQKNPVDQKLSALLSNLKNENKNKKIAISENDGLIFVNSDDVIRCESDGSYTYFILVGGKRVIASKTLGEYEDLLSDISFFRIHRSHLINLNHLKKYIKGEGGYVVLSDNSQVEVSRRKKNDFMERLSNM